MGKTITIAPVSRIEGHAKVTIQLDDTGNVSDTQVHVVELRGFGGEADHGEPFRERVLMFCREVKRRGGGWKLNGYATQVVDAQLNAPHCWEIQLAFYRGTERNSITFTREGALSKVGGVVAMVDKFLSENP